MNLGMLRRKAKQEEDLSSPPSPSQPKSPLPPALLPSSPPLPSPLHHARVFLRESLLFPLMSMYFVMLLINTILRDTKDTMLVNSVAGVAAIPILKSWITIPTSFAFFVVYSKLIHSPWFSTRGKFVIILFSFAGFFTVFALMVYPLRKYISPRIWAQSIRIHSYNNRGMDTFVSTLEEWTLGLFYIVCELWSSAVCQLLFWSVANDVMTIREAKEIYPIIGAMGNFGLVVAGRLLLTFADRRDVDSARAYLYVIDQHHDQIKNSSPIRNEHFIMDPLETGWAGTLFMIAVLVCIGSVFITVCYDDVYRRQRLYHTLLKREEIKQEEDIREGKREHSMTMGEAVQFLYHSKPLRLVTILVASYGISSSLIEVSWKGQVKLAFESSGEYSRFMGSFWTWTGLSSMACMILSRAMLQRLGYRVAVMFTPFVMLCAGGLFFTVAVSVALGNQEEENTKLNIAAYAGAIAVLVSKSAKYAVFDATKEMVFIPLDEESRSVGKAAIDVVAYRLSKSGGSFVLQFVLLTFGNLEGSGLGPIGCLFLVILLAWMHTAYETGKMVHEAQCTEALILPPSMIQEA
ncbi:hypothetical protein BASA81_001717 [Batrachochytrium salamandrivorans]|nr:hypothetical protein BASA81_001717 [Batrachochytrium salamandrivorans]